MRLREHPGEATSNPSGAFSNEAIRPAIRAVAAQAFLTPGERTTRFARCRHRQQESERPFLGLSPSLHPLAPMRAEWGKLCALDPES